MLTLPFEQSHSMTIVQSGGWNPAASLEREQDPEFEPFSKDPKTAPEAESGSWILHEYCRSLTLTLNAQMVPTIQADNSRPHASACKITATRVKRSKSDCVRRPRRASRSRRTAPNRWSNGTTNGDKGDSTPLKNSVCIRRMSL